MIYWTILISRLQRPGRYADPFGNARRFRLEGAPSKTWDGGVQRLSTSAGKDNVGAWMVAHLGSRAYARRLYQPDGGRSWVE
jgi:hypothetical protein